jgi:hypothetical protein
MLLHPPDPYIKRHGGRAGSVGDTREPRRTTMGRVIADVSMSLDGFIAGTDVGVEVPMGKGGEKLHDWLYEGNAGRSGGSSQTSKTTATGVSILTYRPERS